MRYRRLYLLRSEIHELVPFHIVDGDMSFLHKLVHEGIFENDVLHLGVDVEGERPQVVQRILLEKRSQSGCLCGGMSVRPARKSEGSLRRAVFHSSNKPKCLGYPT